MSVLTAALNIAKKYDKSLRLNISEEKNRHDTHCNGSTPYISILFLFLAICIFLCRSISAKARGNGKECKGEKKEEAICNRQSCPSCFIDG